MFQTRRLTGICLVLLLAGSITPLADLAAQAPLDQPQPVLPARSGPQPTAPQETNGTFRYQRNLAGDSKPILLDADEIITWIEKGQRLILLQGQVLAQQGTVRVRANAAVAFVNLDRLQRSGILHIDLYAEQEVFFEDGRLTRNASRALLDLNTRGELRLNSHRKKVAQQPMGDAPLFRRAISELTGGRIPPGGQEEISEPAARRSVPSPAPVIPPTGAPTQPPEPAQPRPSRWRLPRLLPWTSKDVRPANGSLDSSGRPAVAREPRTPGQEADASGDSLTVDGRGAETTTEKPRFDPALVQAQFTQPAPAPTTPAPAVPGPTTPPAPGRGSGGLLPNALAGGNAPLRQYSVLPRSSAGYQFESKQLPTGEQASVFTGGVIIGVRNSDGSVLIDIEADNALVWSRGSLTSQMIDNLRSPQGQTSRELEFYLSGNVQILQGSVEGTRKLTADEIYLDVNRNVAIATSAGIEFRRRGFEQQPIILRADELRQLSATRFEALRAEIFSSKLPSDPGLKVVFTQATLDEVRVPRRSLFGEPVTDRRTGEPAVEIQRPVTGTNALFTLEDAPFFYLPYFQADANDPLGPIDSFRFGANRIFGAQFNVTLDVYDLFNVQPVPDTRWRLDVDYLSRRGPALGTQFDYLTPLFLGAPAKVAGTVRAYGIRDIGTDILGGGRGENENPPEYRGRFLFRQNVQDLPDGFSFQTQFSALSDRNFLEQYFKQEFDQDINQETFVYIKQQQGNLAFTGLIEPRLRDWVNETEALPRVDALLLGVSPFSFFTYNGQVSLGYYQLKNSDDMLPLVSPTDPGVASARLDLLQELSLPLFAGPIKVVPYALLDLTYYSQDLTGESNGRVWGGGGLRASLPLTRFYPEVQSLLLNLNSLNHKIVLSGDYRVVGSTDPFSQFSQFDRINDDVTDQALRDLRPQLPAINPQNGLALATSPLFDPQIYAFRRMVENRIETRDDLQLIQTGIRQRLQTKRGFPGRQHIVDWMTLDVTTSFFPAKDRDNFGEVYSFLEYDYLWNIGDRTALTSSGWVDPFDGGARVFAIGAFLDRPDRTNFYLGYRQIDPVQSKAVTAAATYIFSPKYAMTLSSTYDFGTSQSLSNSFVFTRMGTDLNIGLGFTYNALQNNFGVLFEILPNLVAPGRLGSATPVGGLLGQR